MYLPPSKDNSEKPLQPLCPALWPVPAAQIIRGFQPHALAQTIGTGGKRPGRYHPRARPLCLLELGGNDCENKILTNCNDELNANLLLKFQVDFRVIEADPFNISRPLLAMFLIFSTPFIKCIIRIEMVAKTKVSGISLHITLQKPA